MYRYQKVRQFIESIFRRFNVEFLPGATLNGLERPLLVRHEGLGKYLFFLPPGLVGAEKNEAVGLEVARLLLGQDAYRPRTEAERLKEANERFVAAAHLLIPQGVVSTAVRESWSAQDLAEEALVTAPMAAYRLLNDGCRWSTRNEKLRQRPRPRSSRPSVGQLMEELLA